MTAFVRPQTLSFLLAAAAVGCGGPVSVAPPAAAPAPSAASSTAPVSAPQTGPRIVGTVLASTGDPPKNGGIVYLEDAPKLPGVGMTATVDVKNKEFSPSIAVVTTGGVVTFGNKDALTHHVFSPDIQLWDTGYLQKNDTAGRTFNTPGAIALLCNIHPEMIGYVLVIPSTFFGRVGADGKYVIGNVPPGTYRATLWAPRLPPTTQSVTVTAAGAATANFQLPATVLK